MPSVLIQTGGDTEPMSDLSNRLYRLEARSKPHGGELVTTYWDAADNEKLAQAQREADENGTLLVVIQKFGASPFHAR
jgi:hypothetical protein